MGNLRRSVGTAYAWRMNHSDDDRRTGAAVGDARQQTDFNGSAPSEVAAEVLREISPSGKGIRSDAGQFVSCRASGGCGGLMSFAIAAMCCF
jgi:hypothetical protein